MIGYREARQHFKIEFCFPICSMSNPASSAWVVFSTATSGTMTYSQARGGGGGVTASNFDPNETFITEQPHKEDKHKGWVVVAVVLILCAKLPTALNFRWWWWFTQASSCQSRPQIQEFQCHWCYRRRYHTLQLQYIPHICKQHISD